MMIYEARDVTAGYGGRKVLKDLAVTVGEGEFVSIIGPNGAGKSTLIKVLSGNIMPSGGTVSFKKRQLDAYHPRDLAREFSIVHQFHENILPYSVYEFVRMGRFPHQGLFEIETEEDRDVIQWAVKITDIGQLLGRRLTALSGGELQMVHIAHSLAQNRDVLLLDEPITHLDINHSIGIMDILHDLNRKGATIVTVLHDINIASDYSSRIIGMKEGSVFFNGRPEEVLRYDLVEELFQSRCIVLKNPTSGRPFVYPVPGHLRDKKDPSGQRRDE